jgi:hypothetical protein
MMEEISAPEKNRRERKERKKKGEMKVRMGLSSP